MSTHPEPRFRIVEKRGDKWFFIGGAHRIEWALDCIHAVELETRIVDRETGQTFRVARINGRTVATAIPLDKAA